MNESLVPLALIALAVCFALSLAGVFSDAFHDNWLQHIGMVALGPASAFKAWQIWTVGAVSHETVLLVSGLACFGCGVALKVWQHRPKRHVKRRIKRPAA